MGHNSSKISETVHHNEIIFQRAKTMLDVSNVGAGDSVPQNQLPRSVSESVLNTSTTKPDPTTKSYQQALEWGRNEHFLKLAHTFNTNNY
ncbi:unnamed protein product [Caenorhabditis angaria]|uniref:Uncharacterized protein n=1 Tax=Caenorhabditis angaria TaxID=860376 RepID=A0A9P1IWB4_9PELO|nr:unnamed protein product [Caenorhabditis angaria]